jgi:2-haloacid dehalogenase
LIDFSRFEAMSFDCYGTLIDWETGIVEAVRPVLENHGVVMDDGQILEAFAAHESDVQQSEPFTRYREVLPLVLERIAEPFGFKPSDAELASFAESVAEWPAFPDSAEALARLKRRFKLAVITNCDDDLFAHSNQKLGVEFDWIITAQQAEAYKPASRSFELAFETIDVPKERLLHVAQSLFHDHQPAKEHGLTTVWINRRQGRPGTGATPPAEATPDLEVPDLKTLADMVEQGGST